MDALLMPMYGRRIVLRNCGRFVHVSSDFGSAYSTHAHLSSEMLYAGLTRERSRVPREFLTAMDSYRFTEDFDLSLLPLWFTVGTVVARRIAVMAGEGDIFLAGATPYRDTHTFNSILERAPEVHDNKRLPKFGTIETLLPDQRFSTIAISPDRTVLARFDLGQVFWMGKKRTMFQITNLTGVLAGRWEQGPCVTPPIQIVPRDVGQFDQMEVLAATQRCLVVRGRVRNVRYVSFGEYTFGGDSFGVPMLALQPLIQAQAG